MLDRHLSPDTRIVSRKERPPVLERGCDICVVGSGASGISAAVEAARAGRSVILVDGLPSLGGQAGNSIIGMFFRSDMCVVGSGASGISAAVEAARAGRSVILVDGLPSLGGQAVNSIIGMFC